MRRAYRHISVVFSCYSLRSATSSLLFHLSLSLRRETQRVRDLLEAPISTALPFRHPLCNSVHRVSCRTARRLSLSTVRSACIILAVENNGRAFNDSAQDGSVYPPFSAHLNVQSILLRVFRASSKWLTRKIALFLVHQLSVVFALRSFCMFTATKFAFLFFRH